ncbi:hypothetical protein ACIBL6_15825 [Streptomyces sp. NPDC050400]|uniref:hypothetical protein n=1 Tax=Streptomyces sp. NPDC050400 TaxID=3365610 RepID=UPI00378B334A
MGRLLWGKVTGTMFLAMGIAAASGCSFDAKDARAPSARKPRTVSVQTATMRFQDAVAEYDMTGCESHQPGTCWEQMLAVIKPARELRKAMHTDKSVNADAYRSAYALIEKMERGIAVGKDRRALEYGNGDDLGAIAPPTNRPAVFGSAHELNDWLDEHPVK